MRFPKQFPHYQQLDQMDCGPTCLKMIAQHYGKSLSIQYLRQEAHIDRQGVSMLGIADAADKVGFRLNAPVLQFISFVQDAQDAKISLERLGEIHNKRNEDDQQARALLIPKDKNLTIKNLDFRYGDPNADFVLQNISLTIPHRTTTAIVGASGGGKTTLLKLLLKFYAPEKGEIKLGDTPINNLDSRLWRANIGTVMQDGFLFSDSIARNIALGQEVIDTERLLFAADIANIRTFVESLPLNYNTKIVGNGIGLSQGQRQRIMIARAVYKDPAYLFFDEATSALDAKNEREITEKIAKFTSGRTVVVIAHRLSTVKNADQIVVLDKGSIAEIGTHTELAQKKGIYYGLVKNQLDLDSTA